MLIASTEEGIRTAREYGFEAIPMNTNLNRMIRSIRETKIFDPKDGFAPLADPVSITDPTIAWRDGRWWMCAGGKVVGSDGIHLFSASLPVGAPLSSSGWSLTSDRVDPKKIEILAGYENSRDWDFKGGRHCPCYVKGWDPNHDRAVERIYYAGAAAHPWGPYGIGFLEWNEGRWIDQPEPVFTATEGWEHGSVYEPNVIYHDGKWKMWYAAGSNQEDYIVQGFVESEDGRTGWSEHRIFLPAERKAFDFHVFRRREKFEAVFSRVWFGSEAAPSDTGLWWCCVDAPSPDIAQWSEPLQIMTAEDRGWHAAPWKPSACYSDADPNRLFVFFDGVYHTGKSGAFPYAFTLGSLEIDWLG